MMPLIIAKTDLDDLFYVEFIADVVTPEGNDYLSIVLSFIADSDKDKKLIEESPFYVLNLDKRQKLIYDKFKPATGESYLTSFNMSKRYDDEGYFDSKLYDSKTLKDNGLLHISDNMFIRISLFLESLLKYSTVEFEMFTESYYDFMEKKENLKYSKTDKAIMNGNLVYIVSIDKKKVSYMKLRKPDYLKLKESL